MTVSKLLEYVSDSKKQKHLNLQVPLESISLDMQDPSLVGVNSPSPHRSQICFSRPRDRRSLPRVLQTIPVLVLRTKDKLLLLGRRV